MVKPFLVLGIASILVGLALIVPRHANAAAAMEYLEVADFDDLMALTPAARAKYIGQLRSMMVDLAATDAGSDYEFFSGNSQHYSANLPGWKKGYVALLNAMESRAEASDEIVPLNIECPEGFKTPVRMSNNVDKSVCTNGTLEEQDCYAEDGILIMTAGAPISSRFNTYCVPAGFYEQDSDKNKKWVAYNEEHAKVALSEMARRQKTRGDTEQKLCEGKRVKCGAPPKKDKKHAGLRRKYHHARKGSCFIGGNLSGYNTKEAGGDGGSGGIADVRAGNCAPVRSLSYGDVKVHCDPKDANAVLCSPILFDIEHAESGKDFTGVCVKRSGRELADCNAAFNANESSRSKSEPYQPFWELLNNGAQEAYLEQAAAINDSCKDDSIREYFCGSCAMVQDRLRRANAVLKNCGIASTGRKHKHGRSKQRGTST